MTERGFTLIEALVVLALTASVVAGASAALSTVPAQSAVWDEAAGNRQRLRMVQTRVGRLVGAAAPIVVRSGDDDVGIPAIWPRRLGLVRPSAAGDVDERSVTFLLRPDAHRALTLTAGMSGSWPVAAVSPADGCGRGALCGLRPDDSLLAVARDGACALYRVQATSPILRLEALMEPGAAVFEAGSTLVPIMIVALTFDPATQSLRMYDGYRSDNVITDGIDGTFAWPTHAARLDDGPFVGGGALAYDADQRLIGGLAAEVSVGDASGRVPMRAARLWWRVGVRVSWP